MITEFNIKDKCYFISPHLDDAVFSAGYLMQQLSKTLDVTVINIFTGISNSALTLSAKNQLKICGFADESSFMAARIAEDEQVLKYVGAKHIKLNYIDALMRKKSQSKYIPELSSIYPIFKLNVLSGKVSKHDSKLLLNIANDLKQIIDTDDAVFCPLSIGNHVDHVLVKNIISENFKNIYYYSDFPYVLKNKVDPKIINNKQKIIVNIDKNEKIKLLNFYKTQRITKMEPIDEVYYH